MKAMVRQRICLGCVMAILVCVLRVIECQPTCMRIGVIGGGIGGAASSYYMSKYCKCCNVTIFEQNDYLGGRLKHLDIDGATVNLGGDAWSNVNEYMMELQKELSIPLDQSDDGGNGQIGLYAGDGHWIKLPWSDYLSEGLLLLAIEEVRVNLWENYIFRSESSFPTVESFVSYGGLDKYTKVTALDFLKSWGLSDAFLNDSVLPLTRVIYDQGLQASAFATMVSLLSATTDGYSALGGNDQFVLALANRSKAQVNLNTKVQSVTLNSDGKYSLAVTSQSTKGKRKPAEQSIQANQEFDAVILAAPIEFVNIQWKNINLPPNLKMRNYQHWYVTMIVALGLNNKYFGLPAGAVVPDHILTSGNSTAPFVVISAIAVTNSNQTVYKIFSNKDVRSVINDIFINVKKVYVQYWPYTFPDLHPIKKGETFQPIELSQRLLYLNTIESVAAAMEGSVIAARNAALRLTGH